MENDPHMRAVLAVAAAGREVADSAYALVCAIGEPSTPRDRIREWRKVRLRALNGLDRCVLVELLAGATWEEVADGYGLSPEEMEARFSPALHRWREAVRLGVDTTPGLPGDPDPAGTARALDAWAHRHAEPWMECAPDPVSRAIART